MKQPKPKTAVVFSCGHAMPEVGNQRFSWLGNFLFDVKPDYVIDLGDGADMPSLNSYDERNPKAVVMNNYGKDIKSYLDSQERLRHPFRHAKKKKPFWIGFEGNHENRIKKAIQHNPRIEGPEYGLSFGHLETDSLFDEYHEYHCSAPSIADYDGVSYAHYFGAGNFGRAISGVHHAYALLQHRNHSSTCGHSHKRGVYFKDGAHPNGLIGLVAGCYKGKEEAWAGQSNNDWWKGVVVKREIAKGIYEPEFVSMETIKKNYS